MQKSKDFCENLKLQLKDFNKKLKKVYLEEERRKMIEGKIDSVFILCLNKLNVILILILKLNLIIEQQSFTLFLLYKLYDYDSFVNRCVVKRTIKLSFKVFTSAITK